MKLTIALFAAVFLTASAYAQSAGIITIASGGTNNVAVSATNTYTAFAVSDFDNVGVQVTLKGTGAATSTVQLEAYKSLDSTSYETTPSTSQLITLNGTTAVTTVLNIATPSAGTMKLVLGNTNASVAVTNVAIVRRVKAPKRN